MIDYLGMKRDDFADGKDSFRMMELRKNHRFMIDSGLVKPGMEVQAYQSLFLPVFGM